MNITYIVFPLQHNTLKYNMLADFPLDDLVPS